MDKREERHSSDHVDVTETALGAAVALTDRYARVVIVFNIVTKEK